MRTGSAVNVLDDIARIALTWLPLLMICLIVYLLWRMVQLMPRVKPARGFQAYSCLVMMW